MMSVRGWYCMNVVGLEGRRGMFYCQGDWRLGKRVFLGGCDF